MVEFTVQEPGTYSIVDHSLGRMEKGVAAQIVVQGEQDADVFHVLKTGSGGSGPCLGFGAAARVMRLRCADADRSNSL